MAGTLSGSHKGCRYKNVAVADVAAALVAAKILGNQDGIYGQYQQLTIARRPACKIIIVPGAPCGSSATSTSIAPTGNPATALRGKVERYSETRGLGTHSDPFRNARSTYELSILF